ncbi:hypothetical protein MKW92_011221 [Papaver armeniacum]|nr:hypothetical protein MKW92_011221 [Papaver armeniacum]
MSDRSKPRKPKQQGRSSFPSPSSISSSSSFSSLLPLSSSSSDGENLTLKNSSFLIYQLHSKMGRKSPCLKPTLVTILTFVALYAFFNTFLTPINLIRYHLNHHRIHLSQSYLLLLLLILLLLLKYIYTIYPENSLMVLLRVILKLVIHPFQFLLMMFQILSIQGINILRNGGWIRLLWLKMLFYLILIGLIPLKVKLVWRRNSLLFFMGNRYRKEGGKVRDLLFQVLESEEDVIIKHGAQSRESRRMATQGMHSSKFCLHPAGDTPSACRLFDAIVSLCIPVITTKIAIFVDSDTAVKPGHLTKMLRKIRTEKILEYQQELKEVKRYFEYDDPNGTVNEIWRQVTLKLPLVKLMINRDKRLVRRELNEPDCSCLCSNKTGARPTF